MATTTINKLAARAFSPNTEDTYAYALRRLHEWLQDHELELSDASIASCIDSLYASGLSQSLCSLVVSAVNWHAKYDSSDSPIGIQTSLTLAGIRRSPKQGHGQVTGISWLEANHIAELRRSKGTLAGLRNASLIRVGSDALLRPSEMQAINVRDIEFLPELNCSILTIRRSKTDPEGVGNKKILGPKTTSLVLNWLDRAGISNDRVFRRLSRRDRVCGPDLTTRSIRSIIKASAEEAGLKGRFSGQSLRVGSAQTLAVLGVSDIEMMLEGRWSSPRMPAHYASGILATRSATARLRYGVVNEPITKTATDS